MRRRFCEGEGDDSAGCPPGPAIGILVGEPTEPERTAEQSQVLTQETEIVLNLARFHSNTRLLLQAARGAALLVIGAWANLRRLSHFGACRRRRRECNLHPR
jgi:hypothetical protein